jgi:hypothetical protein
MASKASDLSNYPDGQAKIGNEDRVKYLLSQWIEAPQIKVLWEKKNPFNKPIFESETLNRPDLLILHPEGDVAVETKYADSMSNVLDGIIQVLRYSQDKSIFYADGRVVVPNCYVLATQFSLKGHLFEFEKKEVPRTAGKDFAARMGELPLREYRYTHMALRLLWRFGEFHKKAYKWPWDVGIGFLLSSALNRPDDPIFKPLIQAKIDDQQFCREL